MTAVESCLPQVGDWRSIAIELFRVLDERLWWPGHARDNRGPISQAIDKPSLAAQYRFTEDGHEIVVWVCLLAVKLAPSWRDVVDLLSAARRAAECNPVEVLR